MSTQAQITELITYAQNSPEFRGFSIKFKNESRFHKLIGKIIKPFNPHYLDWTTTTLGKTIWFSSRGNYSCYKSATLEILMHELVHVADYIKAPVKYMLNYLFPQVLGALSLLALLAIPFGNYWLVNLLFLLYLLPWKSNSRLKIEERGYSARLLFNACITNMSIDDYYDCAEATSKTMRSSVYYWMAPKSYNIIKIATNILYRVKGVPPSPSRLTYVALFAEYPEYVEFLIKLLKEEAA